MENDQVQSEIENPDEKEVVGISQTARIIYTIISILFLMPLCLTTDLPTDPANFSFQLSCLPAIVFPIIAITGIIFLWDENNIKRQRTGRILIIVQIVLSIAIGCVIVGLYSMLILLTRG